jgi:hypothetical protein
MVDVHKLSFLTNTQCIECVNFIYLKLLDQDIDHEMFKNRCKECKNIINEIPVKKLASNAQRIHVIGNHWPLVNSLKHRKFAFFCGNQRLTDKDSICITDTTQQINKMENKLIITQGYDSDYVLTSVDFLLVEKKHVKGKTPFDIPDKGFLVIDLRNWGCFYTEG